MLKTKYALMLVAALLAPSLVLAQGEAPKWGYLEAWVDYDGDVGDNTTGEIGALFTFLNDRMGIGANWETGGSDTLRAFFRLNFGK